jgi:hypothetical protein
MYEETRIHRAASMCAGLSLTDHTFTVPLDYGDSSKGTISIFVREVIAYNRPKQILPYLLFLQGRPMHCLPGIMACILCHAVPHAPDHKARTP